MTTSKKVRARQRLLYLNAVSRSIRSQVMAFALHEPVPGSHTGIITEPGFRLPYDTVMDAIIDGWRVVHFPDQRNDGDPVETGVMGYEFILEKIENYDD